MTMDSYYQTPYAQNQIKFEPYQPQILMKSRTTPPAAQDYSIPLHVDCSVEYELPDCAKPPQGVKIEPLLMIHPCHFRNLERQRRRPFENNMPHNSIISLESQQQQQQQPKQRISNNNNNNIIQQKQQQQIAIPTNGRNNNNNNYIYNCNFTTQIDYPINNNNNNSNLIGNNNNALINNNNNNSSNTNCNNNNNNNSVQRFRNANLLRTHPYAMPCAPRYADIHYSNSHLPTLIYNV